MSQELRLPKDFDLTMSHCDQPMTFKGSNYTWERPSTAHPVEVSVLRFRCEECATKANVTVRRPHPSKEATS